MTHRPRRMRTAPRIASSIACIPSWRNAQECCELGVRVARRMPLLDRREARQRRSRPRRCALYWFADAWSPASSRVDGRPAERRARPRSRRGRDRDSPSCRSCSMPPSGPRGRRRLASKASNGTFSSARGSSSRGQRSCPVEEGRRTVRQPGRAAPHGVAAGRRRGSRCRAGAPRRPRRARTRTARWPRSISSGTSTRRCRSEPNARSSRLIAAGRVATQEGAVGRTPPRSPAARPEPDVRVVESRARRGSETACSRW